MDALGVRPDAGHLVVGRGVVDLRQRQGNFDEFPGMVGHLCVSSWRQPVLFGQAVPGDANVLRLEQGSLSVVPGMNRPDCLLSVACPDAQWRLLVALARYGGVRTPSESLAIEWSHVDW
jgi:hypothetical protein